MKSSRRQAIKLGMSATASLVVVNGLFEDEAHAQNPQPASDGGWLQRYQFENCRGQSLTVRTPSRSVTLSLRAVDDVPNAENTGAIADPNRFIVRFLGPRAPKLAQGTYWVENRRLGRFQLFLVPGWTSASGTTYTATFNRV
jgi:uncharacterized protein DUF6916